MDISHLNYGIIHSLVGKNDGVSIVIDQSVIAMVRDLGIDLGNIYFLAAHSSPRFNAETHEVFWHKNEIHKTIIRKFNDEQTESLDQLIHEHALIAKKIIAAFVEKHQIDLLIAHNTSHPYNFITAVGLGYYIEDLRKQNILWPKLLVWWHDSYLERDQFARPSVVIRKYLRYLPGTYTDGIIFINSTQPDLARKVFERITGQVNEAFFQYRTRIIPNTHDINWEWEQRDFSGSNLVFPAQDNYNRSFLKNLGIVRVISENGFTLNETVLLLQHTRVVPRKRIELAIDLAFELESRFRNEGIHKCVILLVSGHSGDEQVMYKEFLCEYYALKRESNAESHVFLFFGENAILSHRDIIVDKKYYSFFEVPSIMASYGAIGTYFSEVEGFGNNLLEMVAAGLPVLISKYPVFESDLKPLGFEFPAIDNKTVTKDLVNQAFRLVTDVKFRNRTVRNNLDVLNKHLGHKQISNSLGPLIRNIFTRGID